MWVWSLGWEDPLEKEMVPHSRILAWKTPWADDPSGLQSMGSWRVRHNWALTAAKNTQGCQVGSLLQRPCPHPHPVTVYSLCSHQRDPFEPRSAQVTSALKGLSWLPVSLPVEAKALAMAHRPYATHLTSWCLSDFILPPLFAYVAPATLAFLPSFRYVHQVGCCLTTLYRSSPQSLFSLIEIQLT